MTGMISCRISADTSILASSVHEDFLAMCEGTMDLKNDRNPCRKHVLRWSRSATDCATHNVSTRLDEYDRRSASEALNLKPNTTIEQGFT